MTPEVPNHLRRFFGDARSLLEVIDARRASIVALVAGTSAVLVLLIHRFLGSGDWEWADALAELVTFVATTIIIVGLLEWYRRRRWQPAENEDLRSLTLLASLAVSGWSSPKDVRSSDLDPESLTTALKKQMEKLAKSSGGLDELYRRLIGEKPDLMGFIELSQERWIFEGYYAEGSRYRRIEYLSILVEQHLPALVERRDDPELFTLFVGLRDNVMRAGGAANHADTIIREQVLLDRPPIIEPYLESRSDLGIIDPVVLLSRVIAYATDNVPPGDLLKSPGALANALNELRFANRCVASVRNELEWVEDALGVLKEIIRILSADIRSAIDEVGLDPGRIVAEPAPAPVA